jgi:RiboL-PSP-HEPN
MPSKSRTKFLKNEGDVGLLWKHHQQSSGSGPGRRPAEVEVLNRAAIIFITACWEAYVEDVCLEAFELMIKKARSGKDIPGKVQVLVAKRLIESKDDRKLWALADKGWQDVLRAHHTDVREKWISGWHTPKSKQVNDLFSDVLGMRDVVKAWRWKNMPVATAKKVLDEFVTLRGGIAHRVQVGKTVKKHEGSRYLNHVERLVEKTDAAIASHLQQLSGTSPW